MKKATSTIIALLALISLLMLNHPTRANPKDGYDFRIEDVSFWRVYKKKENDGVNHVYNAGVLVNNVSPNREGAVVDIVIEIFNSSDGKLIYRNATRMAIDADSNRPADFKIYSPLRIQSVHIKARVETPGENAHVYHAVILENYQVGGN